MIEEKDKDFSIYEVPLSLVDNKLDKLIVDKLGLKTAEPDLEDWRELVAAAAESGARDQHRGRRQICRASRRVQVDLRSRSIMPASPTARRFASAASRARISKREGPERLLSGYDGILVPGGFGERGIEGKVTAIRYARTKGIPFFGIVPGHAVRGDRIRPQRVQSGRAPTRPSSTRTRRTR